LVEKPGGSGSKFSYTGTNLGRRTDIYFAMGIFKISIFMWAPFM